MDKLDIGRQSLSYILVFGELQSVVIGDGVNLISIRNHSFYDTLVHWFGVFGVWLGQNRVFGFALYMGSDYALVAFTDYRIAFPVTDPGFTVNDSWTVMNILHTNDRKFVLSSSLAWLRYSQQLR